MARFTIYNEDNHPILVSKSLREKMKQKDQQQQQSARPTADQPSSFNPEGKTEVKSSSIPSEDKSYAKIYPELPSPSSLPPSPDPFGSNFQQLPSGEKQIHFGYDTNHLLLELRNEYERKLQHYRMLWYQNLQNLDNLNKELLNKNKELFANEIKRVDEQVLKKHFEIGLDKSGKIREQPCKEIEDKIIECFEKNGKRSLLCGDLIRQFSRCVDQNRTGTLK